MRFSNLKMDVSGSPLRPRKSLRVLLSPLALVIPRHNYIMICGRSLVTIVPSLSDSLADSTEGNYNDYSACILSRFLAIHAAGILFLPLPLSLGEPAVHVLVISLSFLHPSVVRFYSTTYARTDLRIHKSSMDLCLRQYVHNGSSVFLQSIPPSMSNTSDE